MLRNILLLCALAVLPAGAAELTVEVDGSGQFPTIQDAMNAAARGDSILIGPGTYNWSNQNTDQWPAGFRGMIQFLNADAEHSGDPRAGTANDIVLIGREGRLNTIIDAERKGRVIYASGAQSGDDNVAQRFTLKGLTFQHGFAQGPIETNMWGGGAATHLASPTFINCRFLENEAEKGGGGLFPGGQNKGVIENCVFIDNRAPFGAGVLIINTSRNNTVWRDCRFESNVATQQGGGMYIFNAQTELDGCIFIANFAPVHGSALASNIARPVIIRNSFMVGNQGASSTVWFRHAIDPEYTGNPMPLTSTVEITNTLIASNGNIGLEFEKDVDATVQCTNIYGHPLGNWMNYAQGMRTVNGNGTFDPHLCGTKLRLRQVCEHSPALGTNNVECATDIGGVVGSCTDCEIIDYVPNVRATNALPSYPNPFSDSTTIDYQLLRQARVRITIYDVRGRAVRRLVDQVMGPGPRQAGWDGRDDTGRAVASGVYLCEFEAGEKNSRTPMLLVR